jgi:hypothetical protein
LSAEKGSSNEGPGIGKEDLRQVQSHHAPRCGAGDLRERKAQAAPGLSETGIGGNFRNRDQGPEISKDKVEQPL